MFPPPACRLLSCGHLDFLGTSKAAHEASEALPLAMYHKSEKASDRLACSLCDTPLQIVRHSGSAVFMHGRAPGIYVGQASASIVLVTLHRRLVRPLNMKSNRSYVKSSVHSSKWYPGLLCRGFFLHRNGVLIAPLAGNYPHVFVLILYLSIS